MQYVLILDAENLDTILILKILILQMNKLFATVILSGIAGLCLAQNTFFSMDMSVGTSRRAFESRDVKRFNLWEVAESECTVTAPFELTTAFDGVPKSSQSNLYDMARYGVKISNQLVGPVERNFFLQTPFLNVVTYPDADKIYGCMTGLFYRKEAFIDNKIRYFELLNDQINYIIDELDQYPLTKNGQTYECRIIRSKQDIKDVMQSPNKTGIVMSIWGGHSLSSYYFLEEERYRSLNVEFENTVLTNIDRLKGAVPIRLKDNKYLSVPIFSIQFSNFFEDGICGKSVLFSVAEEEAFGQQPSIGKDFSELGEKVIERLLDKSKGRRILIDVNGMSLAARENYYKFVQERRTYKDTIPILALGVGISGQKKADSEYSSTDEKVKSQSTLFNHRQANLCKEDIIAILKSKGLIGISLERDRLMGKYFQTRYNATVPNSAERRRVVIDAIVANICKIIHSCNSIEAWDIVSIGSMFDTHGHYFDGFDSSDDMYRLGKDLLAFFKNPRDIDGIYTAKEITNFTYKISPENLVDKIMYKNSYNFLLKHLPEVK